VRFLDLGRSPMGVFVWTWLGCSVSCGKCCQRKPHRSPAPLYIAVSTVCVTSTPDFSKIEGCGLMVGNINGLVLANSTDITCREDTSLFDSGSAAGLVYTSPKSFFQVSWSMIADMDATESFSKLYALFNSWTANLNLFAPSLKEVNPPICECLDGLLKVWSNALLVVVYTLINSGKVYLFSKFGVLGCGGDGTTSSMLVRGLCCWLVGVFDPVVCW
jgi:hypothetical protein